MAQRKTLDLQSCMFLLFRFLSAAEKRTYLGVRSFVVFFPGRIFFCLPTPFRLAHDRAGVRRATAHLPNVSWVDLEISLVLKYTAVVLLNFHRRRLQILRRT